MNRCLACLGLLSLFCPEVPAPVAEPPPAAAAGQDPAQATAQLAQLRARIATLTARLGTELKERNASAARLRETELTVTARRRQLESLRMAQAAAERRRAELRIEQAQNQTALDVQRASLSAQARAAYMLGQQEGIKMLLNQSDPASAARMLVYYGYFAHARSANIDAIRGRVQRLQELLAAVLDNAAKLQVLRADARQNMQELQQARAARLAAFAAARDQVSGGAQELERLKREAQAEEALLAELSRTLQDVPVEPQQNFAALSGRLAWPVAGKLDPAAAGLHRNGVLIEGTRGTKVRAPYFGRVVYADWLQGLGLLLIIAHSGNYMTLYGHAEVLYKSVGDWVAPGDVIAGLADSSSAPQLYFEIRAGRKALDPTLWLLPSP